MKKLLILLSLCIAFASNAQINYCDSLSYVALPQQTLTVIGNSSLSPNVVDSITWSWQACNSALCYSGSGDTASFINILTTDTVKVCYNAYIYFMGATYVCMDCDSLVYDANSYSWVLLSIGNPTVIKELIVDKTNDNKMYDLLGREIFEAPIGTIYIRNRKKFIK